MLRGMTDLLEALHAPLLEEVAGLEIATEGLRGQLDLRYGLLTFQIDHEEEAEALRVSVRLPPPVAAGHEFLVWCLAQNTQSWEAKFGLEDSGYLVVHADLPAPADGDVEIMRDDVTDCIDSIAELIDDSLCPYLLERRLGTPAQLERWSSDSD